MAKVQLIKRHDEANPNGKDVYMIYSPADEQFVPFDDRWTFNGDFEKPTFRPSMLYTTYGRNHFFVTDGKIEYLSDCEHDMAGTTIDMIECDY